MTAGCYGSPDMEHNSDSGVREGFLEVSGLWNEKRISSKAKLTEASEGDGKKEGKTIQLTQWSLKRNQ